jgi:hypothetical protein
MVRTTSGNPDEYPAGTRDDTHKPVRGKAGLGDDLDNIVREFSAQPAPAEVETRPDDRDLTADAQQCQNAVEMPTKQALPGQDDPALQKAFDAFDDVKLPRPPLTKLTGLTPAEGLEVLRTLLKYLDCMGDPVANVVRVVFSELSTRSFETLDETREFFAAAQSIFDRTGFGVLCPSCSEIGKLDVAASKQLPTGAIRVKHGRMSTHGGGSTIHAFEVERVTEHPSR